ASAIARDITERRRAQDALRQSEESFRTLANSAPVMLWMTNSDGQVIFRNHYYLRFVGQCDLESAEDWSELIHPADRESRHEVFASSFAKREPYMLEYRLRKSSGVHRWVLETGIPRLIPDGTFLGYAGSCVDITERKWAEQALRGAFDELEMQVADSHCELE